MAANSSNELSYMTRSLLMNQILNSPNGSINLGKQRLKQILQMFIVLSTFENFIDPVLKKLPAIPRYFITKMLQLMRATRSFTCQRFLKVVPMETRTTIIPSITEGIQENKLYTSIEWYVNRHVQHDEATVKKDTIMEKTGNKKDIVVSLPEKKDTVIQFQGFDIKVCRTSEAKKILTDRPVERLNRIYTLSYVVKESDERDILQDFVTMCDTEYQRWLSKQNKVPKVYKNNGKEWKEQGPIRRRRPETVVLRDNMTKKIMDDLEHFHTNEDKYASRDILYARHYLFYGKPGTGKSSLMNAIASRYQRSIYFLNLSGVSSDAELDELMKAVPYADAIIVFEDIDAASEIVKRRDLDIKLLKQIQQDDTDDNDSTDKPKSKGKGKEEEKPKVSTLSLAGLLAAIDGTGYDVHNQLMIMTTNHREKLDPALIRPGRVDRHWEFKTCNSDHANDLYCNFFEHELTKKLSTEFPCKELSPADLAGLFIRYLEDDVTAEKQLHLLWTTGQCDD